MNKTCLLIFSSLFFFIVQAGTLPGAENYYQQVLAYGTDRDIAEAFSEAGEDLGDPVNRLVLEAFNREHSLQAYLSLVRYIGEVRLSEAHQALVSELGRRAGDDYLEAVVMALGRLGSPASIEPLQELYHRKNISPRIRKAVVTSWGAIGNPGVQDALIEIVRDLKEPVEVRAAAVLALGEVESGKALSLLEETATNTYERKLLRMYAVYSLGKVGGKDALDTLGALIHDETHEVAEYAVLSISDIESGKRGELLIEALRSDYDKVRFYAAKGLGDMGYAPALDILRFKASHDSSEAVRLEAERALSSIEDSEVNHGAHQ